MTTQNEKEKSASNGEQGRVEQQLHALLPTVLSTRHTITLLHGPDQYIFFRPKNLPDRQINAATEKSVKYFSEIARDVRANDWWVDGGAARTMMAAVARLVAFVVCVGFAVHLNTVDLGVPYLVKWCVVSIMILVAMLLLQTGILGVQSYMRRRMGAMSIKRHTVVALIATELGLEWLPFTDAITAERVRQLDSDACRGDIDKEREAERLYQQWQSKSVVLL